MTAKRIRVVDDKPDIIVLKHSKRNRNPPVTFLEPTIGPFCARLTSVGSNGTDSPTERLA